MNAALDDVYNKGAADLYEKYLVNNWPYYQAEDIIFWNDGVISNDYINIDQGESHYSIRNKWQPDDEPVNLLNLKIINYFKIKNKILHRHQFI